MGTTFCDSINTLFNSSNGLYSTRLVEVAEEVFFPVEPSPCDPEPGTSVAPETSSSAGRQEDQQPMLWIVRWVDIIHMLHETQSVVFQARGSHIVDWAQWSRCFECMPTNKNLNLIQARTALILALSLLLFFHHGFLFYEPRRGAAVGCGGWTINGIND